MDTPPPTRRRIALRLSVTEQCNLRCRYCRPARDATPPRSAVAPAAATDPELLELVSRLHSAYDVYKVRLTGGEPLLHGALPALVRGLRSRVPTATLGLTTNAVRLARAAAPLRRAGLDSVNVSIDTLDDATCRSLTRGGRVAPIVAGLQAACHAGFRCVKINTVLMRSVNGHAVPQLVRFAALHGCEIRFIELMPFGEGAGLHGAEFLPAAEALAALERVFQRHGRMPPSSTAQRHRFQVGRHRVAVGFIPTMTAPFCGACDRFRLNRQGRLYACLRDTAGADLLTPLRAGDDATVRARIRRTINDKCLPAGAWPTRSMVGVGG
jgi:cyclic pyranopterin phosphate synthase